MDRSYEYIVRTAMAAPLEVIDGVADQVHRRVVVKQLVICPISDHNAANSPPDREAVKNTVHSNVAAVALVLTRMLLSA